VSVGDRVRIDAAWSQFFGRVGTVAQVVEASGQVKGWVLVSFEGEGIPIRFGLGEVVADE
jgi:hypothetical protein